MKTFTWCRRELAEGCLEQAPHVHICITGPDCRGIAPKCGAQKLQLFFYDLDPEKIKRTSAFADDPEKGKAMLAGCFSETQARRISAFVAATPDDTAIIVNCEAGVSRSPAVVLALRRHYGGDTEEVFKRAVPNIHVSSILSRVLREQGPPAQSEAETPCFSEIGDLCCVHLRSLADCANLYRKLAFFLMEGVCRRNCLPMENQHIDDCNAASEMLRET
jgi:hypothetical protein